MQSTEVEEAPAPAAESSLQHGIKIEFIDPNPLEPKSRLAVDPELMESIRSLGLLQPIVVRTVGERFEVMAGHRRLAACRELGHKTIPALVFTGEVNGGAILLAENVDRKDFDPLDEAAIVAALLEQGATQQAIADALGHSVPWVARRANLATLSPKVRKLVADPKCLLSTWPPAWLEELALLSPKAQEEFVGEREGNAFFDIRSIDELRKEIEARMRPLRLAPWDVADATLVRSVGSCIDCPKTSCAVAGLFGPEAAGSFDKALCRDSVCWDGKKSEWFARRLKEAKETHGSGLLYFEGSRDADWQERQQAAQLLPKGASTAASWQWKKTSEKKGKPAITIAGPDFGKVVFIAQGGNRSETPDRPRETLADRKKSLHRRWWKKVLARLVEVVQQRQLEDVLAVVAKKRPHKATADRLAFVAQLVARAAAEFGPVLHGGEWSDEHVRAVKQSGAKGNGFAAVDRLPELLWLALRADLAEFVRREISKVGYSLKEDESCLGHFDWLIAACEFDVDAELTAVHEALPEPKSWSGKGAARKPKQRELARDEADGGEEPEEEDAA